MCLGSFFKETETVDGEVDNAAVEGRVDALLVLAGTVALALDANGVLVEALVFFTLYGG